LPFRTSVVITDVNKARRFADRGGDENSGSIVVSTHTQPWSDHHGRKRTIIIAKPTSAAKQDSP